VDRTRFNRSVAYHAACRTLRTERETRSGCARTESFVPGYGDANADFHVVGDHPGVHGGVDDAGIPFTGEPWSTAFLSALAEGGPDRGFDDSADDPATIDDSADGAETADPIVADRTFFSSSTCACPRRCPGRGVVQRHGAVFRRGAPGHRGPRPPPVGARATDHVLQQYTSRAHKTEIDMDALHAEELLGSGWLVLPIKDPAEWTEGDGDRLARGAPRAPIDGLPSRERPRSLHHRGQ